MTDSEFILDLKDFIWRKIKVNDEDITKNQESEPSPDDQQWTQSDILLEEQFLYGRGDTLDMILAEILEHEHLKEAENE